MAFLDGAGIGMTRLPHTFLNASCACLAGIGLPSKYPNHTMSLATSALFESSVIRCIRDWSNFSRSTGSLQR